MLRNGKYFEEQGLTEVYDDEDLGSILRYCGLLQSLPEELDHRTLHRFEVFVHDLMFFDYMKEHYDLEQYIRKTEPDVVRQNLEIAGCESALREREAYVKKYSPMLKEQSGVSRLVLFGRLYVMQCEDEARELDKLPIEKRL